MTIERFIPEDPYTPLDIPVDDMNNYGYYSYNNTKPTLLPLSHREDDGRIRYDLRVLPDEKLAEMGWRKCNSEPAYDFKTQECIWDSEVGDWKIVELDEPLSDEMIQYIESLNQV